MSRRCASDLGRSRQPVEIKALRRGQKLDAEDRFTGGVVDDPPATESNLPGGRARGEGDLRGVVAGVALDLPCITRVIHALMMAPSEVPTTISTTC